MEMSKDLEDLLDEEFKNLELNVDTIEIDDEMKASVVVNEKEEVSEVEELTKKLEDMTKQYEDMLKIKVSYDGIIRKQMNMIEYMGKHFKDYGFDILTGGDYREL